jgi:hypothetical protein
MKWIFVIFLSCLNMVMASSMTKEEKKWLALSEREYLLLEEKKQELGGGQEENSSLIEKIQRQEQSLFWNFTNHVTRIPYKGWEERPSETDKDISFKNKDVLKELQEWIYPFLSGLKRGMERPRRHAQIRNTLDTLEDDHHILVKLKLTLEERQKHYPPSSHHLFQKSLGLIKQRLQQVDARIDQYKRELEWDQYHEQSWWGSISTTVHNIIQKKGMNFLWALLSFLIPWWVLAVGRKKLMESAYIQKRWKLSTWGLRFFQVISGTLDFIVSFGLALFCLYRLNDWTLMALSLILLFSFLWSFKHLAPQLAQEGKILLNLGRVREGELLVWHGLSWRIRSLGLITVLENPAMPGILWRLYPKDLVELYSRPCCPDEEWFPSLVGDWVSLKDGVEGKVLKQMPEGIWLEPWGGGIRYYTVERYLSQDPLNLSKGFSLYVTIGCDYQLINRVENGLLEQLREKMVQELKQLLQTQTEKDWSVSVLISQFASSSMDVEVMLKIEQALAPQWVGQRPYLRKQIQLIFLAFIRESGTSIPFPHLDVFLRPEQSKNQ